MCDSFDANHWYEIEQTLEQERKIYREKERDRTDRPQLQ